MSVRAMTWAWGQDLPAGVKLTLLAIADHSGEDGVCWPGQARLAQKTGYTDRQVRNHIQHLVREGLLLVHRRGGDQRATNVYQLALDHRPEKISGRCSETPEEASYPQPTGKDFRYRPEKISGTDRKNSTADRKPISGTDRKPISAKPSGEPSEEPSGRERRACARPHPPSVAAQQEGSRTPPGDFQPSPADVEWARQHFPDLDLDDFTAEFRLVQFRTTQDDWHIAWRRLARRKARELGLRPAGPAPARPPDPKAAERRRQDLRKLARDMGARQREGESEDEFLERVQRVKDRYLEHLQSGAPPPTPEQVRAWAAPERDLAGIA